MACSGRPFPGKPLNTSATKQSCDKKRSIFHARATIKILF